MLDIEDVVELGLLQRSPSYWIKTDYPCYTRTPTRSAKSITVVVPPNAVATEWLGDDVAEAPSVVNVRIGIAG